MSFLSNLKRKALDVFNYPSQKRKKHSNDKNPVMILHEMFTDLKFDYREEGTQHNRCYRVTTTVDGKSFEAIGHSKQRAKFQLAINILDCFDLPTNTTSQAFSQPDDFFAMPGPDRLLYTPPHARTYAQMISQASQPHAQMEAKTSLYDQLTSTSQRQIGGMMSPTQRQIGGMTSPTQQQIGGIVSPRQRQVRGITAQINHEFENIRSLPDVEFGDSLQIDEHQDEHVLPREISPARARQIMLPPREAAQQGFSRLFANLPSVNVEKARCFPTMMLAELFPELQLEWVEGEGRGDRQFRVEVVVQGTRFFGEGRSKKLAKLNLSKTLLLYMYDISDFKDADAPSKQVNDVMDKKFPLTQLKSIVDGDLTFEVVQQESQSEEKLYHATVVVRNVAYEALGSSKNLAKLRAAKKALDDIKPKKEGTEQKNVVDTSKHPTMVFYEFYRNVEFIESETKCNGGLTEYHMEAEVVGRSFKTKATSKKKAKVRLVLNAFEELHGIQPGQWSAIDLKEVQEEKQHSLNPAANHPIVLLLKLNPQARFEVAEDFTSDVFNKYRATVFVGEAQFQGLGANKKSAKTAAARDALRVLYAIDADNYTEEMAAEQFHGSETKNEVPVEISNKISDAVQNQFAYVSQGDCQCKVLAGFVLVGEDTSVRVVSLGTGTKCISGDQMTHKGQTLNDCHGEIIACRGMRQYLYDQLLQAISKKDSVFMKRGAKFALKSHLKMYLYVNTSPCGDGRVFTLQSQSGAKNKTAGLLRTKIENGQGTIPVPEKNIQTSDGILEGERLRTMSCSDKILKWNALGVQGALLSYFIDPVYLQGVVIGLHYNFDALRRALYTRAGKMSSPASLFRLTDIALGCPNNMDINRNTSKSNSNSFNWYTPQPTMEAVNSVTGKTVVLAPSRLSKLAFFDKFRQVAAIAHPSLKPQTYHDAKMLCVDYQKAKECLMKALEENQCGKWIGKPYEHDMFGY